MRSLPGPTMGLPFTVMSPDVCLSKPAIIFNNVDFPHPEGPSRETNSPRLIFNVTLSKAMTWLLSLLVKDL